MKEYFIPIGFLEIEPFPIQIVHTSVQIAVLKTRGRMNVLLSPVADV